MSVKKGSSAIRELAGLLWGWWQGDPLPSLPPRKDLAVTSTTDYKMLARLVEAGRAKITRRIASHYRPYVAWVGETPVAYGWSASGRTSFGSPASRFTVPEANRYLMDFATLSAWRGQGIYPCLLQAIITQEIGEAHRFWILHQAGNEASRRGIAKAGFSQVAEIHFLNDSRRLGVIATDTGRAEAGAALLGLPLVA